MCRRLADIAGDSLRDAAPRKKRRENAVSRHRARIQIASEIAEKQRAVRQIEARGGVTHPGQRRATRTELAERLAQHAKPLPSSRSSGGRKTPAQQRLDLLAGLENMSLLQIARRLDKIEAINLQGP